MSGTGEDDGGAGTIFPHANAKCKVDWKSSMCWKFITVIKINPLDEISLM